MDGGPENQQLERNPCKCGKPFSPKFFYPKNKAKGTWQSSCIACDLARKKRKCSKIRRKMTASMIDIESAKISFGNVPDVARVRIYLNELCNEDAAEIEK